MPELAISRPLYKYPVKTKRRILWTAPWPSLISECSAGPDATSTIRFRVKDSIFPTEGDTTEATNARKRSDGCGPCSGPQMGEQKHFNPGQSQSFHSGTRSFGPLFRPSPQHIPEAMQVMQNRRHGQLQSFCFSDTNVRAHASPTLPHAIPPLPGSSPASP